MSKLHDRLAQGWLTIQDSLFPWLAEELGELTQKQKALITTLEMIALKSSSFQVQATLGDQHKIEAQLPELLLRR